MSVIQLAARAKTLPIDRVQTPEIAVIDGAFPFNADLSVAPLIQFDQGSRVIHIFHDAVNAWTVFEDFSDANLSIRLPSSSSPSDIEEILEEECTELQSMRHSSLQFVANGINGIFSLLAKQTDQTKDASITIEHDRSSHSHFHELEPQKALQAFWVIRGGLQHVLESDDPNITKPFDVSAGVSIFAPNRRHVFQTTAPAGALIVRVILPTRHHLSLV